MTPEQQEKLEAVFEQAPKPSHAAHQLLATKMGVSPQQTKVWFRDARQRKRVLGQGGSGGGSLGTLQQSENSLLQIEVPLRALKLVTNSPGYIILTREPHDRRCPSRIRKSIPPHPGRACSQPAMCTQSPQQST